MQLRKLEAADPGGELSSWKPGQERARRRGGRPRRPREARAQGGQPGRGGRTAGPRSRVPPRPCRCPSPAGPLPGGRGGACRLRAGPALRHVPPRGSQLPARGHCTPIHRRGEGGYARPAPVSHDHEARGREVRASRARMLRSLHRGPSPSVRPPVRAPRPGSGDRANVQQTQRPLSVCPALCCCPTRT